MFVVLTQKFHSSIGTFTVKQLFVVYISSTSKIISHRPNKLKIRLKILLLVIFMLCTFCNKDSVVEVEEKQEEMNIFKHIVCRNSLYATEALQRFSVPDEFISWTVAYDDYNPPFYESPYLYGKPWADPKIDDASFHPKFNELDDNVNRVSHVGEYKVLKNQPLNPFGRTGVIGRGILGRYGPNHAADPIVSTWKRNSYHDKVKHQVSQKPILRILCIKRSDTGEIALPGGMVDPGEQVSQTLKREFIEEALNGKIEEPELDDFFAKGEEIYRGYVDDPRNTDNAWMESVAVNFHDEDGSFLSKLNFEAGDDAVGVHWIEVDESIHLYASHSRLIKATAELRNAHF